LASTSRIKSADKSESRNLLLNVPGSMRANGRDVVH
jgi:hypothetical protein